MTNPKFAAVSVPLKTRAKIERLARMLAKDAGLPKVPLYAAVDLAIEEALERRKNREIGK